MQRDMTQARFWVGKSAAQGHKQAQNWLANNP